MGHNSILRMMSEISTETNLTRVYTNICLKATISDLLEKQGLNFDTIMNMQSKGKYAMYPMQSSEELMQNSLNKHIIDMQSIRIVNYSRPLLRRIRIWFNKQVFELSGMKKYDEQATIFN
jgi:hypothetical protein